MGIAQEANSALPLVGIAPILREAYQGNQLKKLSEHLLQRIQNDSNDAAALLDLCVILQLNGQPQLALEFQRQALEIRQLYALRSNPAHPRLRVLAILGPGEIMDNTPIEFLLEDSDIALELMYVGRDIPVVTDIPDHDVAFVAVCESDRNLPLLEQLADVMKHWPRPHLNRPEEIAKLSRPSVSQQLAKCPHVAVCDTRRVSRGELFRALASSKGESLSCPTVIRPVDSHAGKGLSKLDHIDDLSKYLEEQTADEFFVEPFYDYRSVDGMYRKYRVVIIEGQPFAAHLAISPRWMVHYLNADMQNHSLNQAEEAAFMAHFEHDWARRHQMALREIDQQFDLDYYSLDCAETRDGKLLVFEVDSGAVIHSMDGAQEFAYKKPPMEAVFAAFRQMLRSRVAHAKSKSA